MVGDDLLGSHLYKHIKVIRNIFTYQVIPVILK
jgi:hypothetical protein